MKNYFIPLCILFFCVQIILLYSLSPRDGHFHIDSPSYDKIAHNFVLTNRLEYKEYPGIIPMHVLGYPLFLGIIYKFFGDQVTIIVFFQMLLCLFTSLLLIRIAACYFNEAIANIIAFLCAINPGFVVFSQFIMGEILLMTVLTIWLERFISFLQTKRYSTLLLASSMLAISTWIKPFALFFAPIWFCYLGYFFWKKDQNATASKLRSLLSAILIFYALITLYIMHNYFIFGTAQFAPAANENLYCYFLPKLIAADKNVSIQDASKEIYATFDGKSYNETERWKSAKKLLGHYIIEKPLLVISIWSLNTIKTIFGLYSISLKLLIDPAVKTFALDSGLSFFASKSSTIFGYFYDYVTNRTNNIFVIWYCIFEAIYSVLRIFCILISLIWLYINYSQYFILFILNYCGYCAIITGHDGCGRYRLAFEPILIFLTAIGIYLIYSYLHSKKFIKLQLGNIAQ
jgi:hypothetical protein